jgi:hypothetical protein
MLGKTIMETLIRTHRVTDPVTGGPVCLGSLALANVQVAADGRLWLVGFGAGSLADACIAPEVASGGAPTPGADVFAVMLFMRAQIAFTELPPALVRVFAGRPLDSDAELMRLLVWANAQILAAPPDGRPSMAEALDRAWQMWRLLGFAPDTAGFAAWLARAIAIGPDAEPVPAVDADRSRIVVGRDGEWIEANGIRHRLASRRPLRRLLFALAEARCARAGSALSVDELLDSGWPGEDPLPEAGSNRVYVAISTLRKLGLGSVLQRWDGGYRLDPAVPFRLEPGR